MKFTLTVIFQTTAKHIFDSWLSSRGHTAMTGGEAKCNKRIGGAFTAWDEYITGKNLEIKPNLSIKQSWRTREFEEGQPHSVLEIKLKQLNPESCQLTLIHSGLGPKDGHYKQGWIDSYFEPMQRHFNPANLNQVSP